MASQALTEAGRHTSSRLALPSTFFPQIESLRPFEYKFPCPPDTIEARDMTLPNPEIQIRPLAAADADPWIAQRHALWPEIPVDQLRAEVESIADDRKQIALGAFDGGKLIGFAELSIHPHAIGCGLGPVAYLEAWRVDDDYRRQGIGGQIIAAGESWSRDQGCREIASDTWIDNDASDRAHRALGFEETDRLIHYRKPL